MDKSTMWVSADYQSCRPDSSRCHRRGVFAEGTPPPWGRQRQQQQHQQQLQQKQKQRRQRQNLSGYSAHICLTGAPHAAYSNGKPSVEGEAWAMPSTSGRILALSVARRVSLGPKRMYLADKKPFYAHTHPKNLISIVVKASLMASQEPFTKWSAEELNRLQNEDHNYLDDDDDEWPLISWDDFKDAMEGWPSNFCRAFLRIMGVTTILRCLEELCIQHLTPRMADRLTKDVWKSVKRKALRVGPYQAAYKVCRTAAYSAGLGFVANFLYDEALLLRRWFVYERQRRYGKALGKRPKPFLEGTGSYLKAYMLQYVFFIAGYGAGTMILPGFGSFIGGLAGENAASMLF